MISIISTLDTIEVTFNGASKELVKASFNKNAIDSVELMKHPNDGSQLYVHVNLTDGEKFDFAQSGSLGLVVDTVDGNTVVDDSDLYDKLKVFIKS